MVDFELLLVESRDVFGVGFQFFIEMNTDRSWNQCERISFRRDTILLSMCPAGSSPRYQ